MDLYSVSNMIVWAGLFVPVMAGLLLAGCWTAYYYLFLRD